MSGFVSRLLVARRSPKGKRKRIGTYTVEGDLEIGWISTGYACDHEHFTIDFVIEYQLTNLWVISMRF